MPVELVPQAKIFPLGCFISLASQKRLQFAVSIMFEAVTSGTLFK